VKIRILEMRIPELGDKFATRHHQKGTIGMLVDAIDMPRTAEGIVPDMMVNPHGLPTRMTVGQLYEQIFCKFGLVYNGKINATNFMDTSEALEQLGDMLEMKGYQRHGEDIMYSGITGEQMAASIFLTPCYFMRLKHLTEDKMNSREHGRREMRTRQPTGGRGNEGGMKIGEMERDILIAHGASEFLSESMMDRSDGTHFMVCNGCGTIPVYNKSINLFVCPLCDGPLKYSNVEVEPRLDLPLKKSQVSFSRVEMPYTLKLMDQEALTPLANIGMRYMTAKEPRQFRPFDSSVISHVNSMPIVEELDDTPLTEEKMNESPSLLNVVGDLVKEGASAIGLNQVLGTEDAIKKANMALLEKEKPKETEQPVQQGGGQGPTIVINTSNNNPADQTSTHSEHEEKTIEINNNGNDVTVSAPPAPAQPNQQTNAPQLPSNPAVAAEPMQLKNIETAPKPQPRKKISWNGGGETTSDTSFEGPVTVLKLG
jgi:hypothetical protein